MSYDDDAKMKLLKEAWTKMEEGEVKNPNTTGKIIANATTTPAPKGLEGTKATGTAVKQGPTSRATVAQATPGAENLAEEEGDDDTGAPASAEEIGTGEAGATDVDAALDGAGDAAMGGEMGAPMSPWDQLVAAVEQMKAALEQIAAEEKGEPAHQGGEMGGEIAPDMGGEEDIGAVAEKYLQEAKKKLKEKADGKVKSKGFIPGKKGVNPFPKK